MVWKALVAAAFIPSFALAQTAGAYHLLVAFDRGGVTSIAYPSKARCDAARRQIEAETAAKMAESARPLPNGGVIVGTPYHFIATCVPA